jgi:hypothetical protein
MLRHHGARLLTDDRIWVDDLSQRMRNRSLQGILGMDCLRHYCLQLDFVNQELRFLDPDHPGSENLGRGFPLTISGAGVTVRETLAGHDAGSGIDSAEYDDGALNPVLFD